MAQVAERYETSINQFLGDGILVFFGAPHEIPLEEGAIRAVKMALEMQERIAHMSDRWRRKGVPKPLSVRIGIHTGYANVGDFGSQGRKVYTAIGMQANVAARIQAQCEPGKILLSDTTQALVADSVQTVDRGSLDVKGVHYPVPVHEVVALVD
jgi:class 3 adenylate cyclase